MNKYKEFQTPASTSAPRVVICSMSTALSDFSSYCCFVFKKVDVDKSQDLLPILKKN